MLPQERDWLQQLAVTGDKQDNDCESSLYIPTKLALVGLIMFTVLILGGCSAVADDLASGGSVESYTCDDLADESVTMSEENNDGFGVELLKVRDPKIINDFRKTYEVPTGTEEALILSCRGMGVWSDGTNSEVKMKLTVDSDSEQWIAYKEM